MNSIKCMNGVELDVWLTADGEVAVVHDGDLGRVASPRARIKTHAPTHPHTHPLTHTSVPVRRLSEAILPATPAAAKYV